MNPIGIWCALHIGSSYSINFHAGRWYTRLMGLLPLQCNIFFLEKPFGRRKKQNPPGTLAPGGKTLGKS